MDDPAARDRTGDDAAGELDVRGLLLANALEDRS
jgi:hypothetical protein